MTIKCNHQDIVLTNYDNILVNRIRWYTSNINILHCVEVLLATNLELTWTLPH